jgi:hypothetical protein
MSGLAMNNHEIVAMKVLEEFIDGKFLSKLYS